MTPCEACGNDICNCPGREPVEAKPEWSFALVDATDCYYDYVLQRRGRNVSGVNQADILLRLNSYERLLELLNRAYSIVAVVAYEEESLVLEVDAQRLAPEMSAAIAAAEPTNE